MGWNCFFIAKLYLLKFGMDKKFNSTRCNYFSMSVKGGLREAWRPQRWSWVYVMTFWVDPCWCPDDPGRRLISITVSADSGAFFLSNFRSSLLVAMETTGSFIQSRVGRSGCPRELFEQVLERPNTTAASTVRECQCDTASQSLHGDNEWGYVMRHGIRLVKHPGVGITILWLVRVDIVWNCPSLQWIVGSRDRWEFLPFCKGHWESPCRALTAGKLPAVRAVQWDCERV